MTGLNENNETTKKGFWKKVGLGVGTALTVGALTVSGFLYANKNGESEKTTKPEQEQQQKIDNTESRLEESISKSGYGDVMFSIEDYKEQGYITQSALESIENRIKEIKESNYISNGVQSKKAKETLADLDKAYKKLKEDFNENAEVDLGVMLAINAPYADGLKGAGTEKENRIGITGLKLSDLKNVLGENRYNKIVENYVNELAEVDQVRNLSGTSVSFEELKKLTEKGEYSSELPTLDERYLDNFNDGDIDNYEAVAVSITGTSEPTRFYQE